MAVSTIDALYNGGSEKISATSTGVDVTGTVTTDGLIVSSGSSNQALLLDSTTGYNSAINYSVNSALKWSVQALGDGTNAFRFYNFTAGAESMRIDSSGNLLVGTTDDAAGAGNSATGISLRGGADNRSFFSVNQNYVMHLNRKGNDGNILEFAKDGATVGSIGIQSYGFEIQGESGHSGISFGTSSWVPLQGGSRTDNAIDIGHTSYRFDDIYATNGTIQTSDRNEKQDIAELSDAEQRVAVACKGLLRKFRWKDSVAEKGDEARTHFGIIAQDLQAAFEAESLDAGDYAMFISTTWWETQTDVAAVEEVEAVEFVQAVEAQDAVEAVDAVYDEEGEIVSEAVEAAEAIEAVEGVEAVEAVEAKGAYTRTDTFDTAEEAPEGAAERTRLGVRYSELLAFIISAI